MGVGRLLQSISTTCSQRSAKKHNFRQFGQRPHSKALTRRVVTSRIRAAGAAVRAASQQAWERY